MNNSREEMIVAPGIGRAECTGENAPAIRSAPLAIIRINLFFGLFSGMNGSEGT